MSNRASITAKRWVVFATLRVQSCLCGPIPSRLQPIGMLSAFAVSLRGRGLLVGRGHCCDVSLPLPTISLHHCRIFRKRGWWFIEDLNSTNGTRVNGFPIARRKLRSGDHVAVADLQFVVR